ncbi:MAG TPA: hypothetical protein DEB30_02790 [Candidatus Peribacter riflensis]|uniref:Uncharacterized protein n=1 Tax=Candidatus Peribacter riflensis TaxID=1735162 RepID=A0A0S1SNU4_9BACT|nr:MAG: hypothetical protein PeribacterA2_0571 [Candidatus Peribacter riflensis]OGJ77100.1 MAG: hypothetical protein A2398_03190 [Candidatus Peribacteria bacterium RIFOXYB1_FULL_57_12]OGJ79035.1 MAG: hypothetical protein A2412_00555 [Candidatus Peribacteria bacterium RIFOXYC1_FULL_58_8]ALM11049.1 MAG: hypothetical protein PeribacterB2_0570 [Candidatus Peribacter riflensis]ALM12152.1 MAG: hypothetical protein PeribacterC2_0570 [Candidatus Peribacter riflensis]
MQLFTSFQSLFDPFLLFLSDDPVLRMIQGALLLGGALIIFLVFFTTRDILLRTHSFWYMALCIVLVALLPVVGFFLYLLLRPARTIRQREQDALVRALADKLLGKNHSSKKSSSEE